MTCLPVRFGRDLVFLGMPASAAPLFPVSATARPDLWAAAFGPRPDAAPPPAAEPHGYWLRAVTLAGQGRYAAARAALTHAAGQGPDVALASLIASTQGSFWRQLGWHGKAARHDGQALWLVAGRTGEQARLARCDALTGLAADALGQGRFELAGRLLERSHDELPHGGGHWRPQVRWHWVAAELALATCGEAVAIRHATVAAALAGAAPSVRHRIKSALLLAAAECAAGARGQALERAHDAARRADGYGLLPLRWAASMLLAGLAPDGPATATAQRCAFQLKQRGGELNL